ncbi:hypothetical protein QJ856_gp0541 [Tupanvirus deep ocean]|uniref:Uncharacterized protein n=2 Tax=Tupanvirus TaxID=2094720 RepID=A0AC62A8W4_9VIRU|nr:hypothetical protein QJ856_gp0541 [Tupanvirus deep ocean]QKU34205.1 hypothetical protein [Tupanvirus deep ocean]
MAQNLNTSEINSMSKITTFKNNDIQNYTDINQQKNINTQKYISYIHVDSSKRNLQPINNYEDLYSLPPYPLYFTNGSSKVVVNFPNHPFQTNDRVALSNVVSKNVMLNNALMVKKNSYFVRIFHQNHGLSLYGLYDPTNENEFTKIGYVDTLPSSYNENEDIPDSNQYYILKDNPTINLMIQLSNIKGSDSTRTFIGNIPINYLNKKHNVYLLFIKNGQTFYSDPNSYLIVLERKSSINYLDGVNYIKDKNGNSTTITATNNVYIKFHNLYGVPLNYLNNGTPINENSKYPHVTILSTTDNTFTIDTNYNAIVDPDNSFYNNDDTTNPDFDGSIITNSNRGGGGQVYIRKIFETIPGYPNPNSYVYRLDKTYKNVIQAKIISSEFPNSQRIINNDPDDVINNKLYWRNLDDGDYIYQLSIEPGNYAPFELKNAIESAFNSTIHYKYTNEYNAGIIPPIIEKYTPTNNLIYDENGYNKYHIVDVDISDVTDKVTFSSYKELVQQDKIDGTKIITVPDDLIEFTMAEDLRKNFGIDINNPNKAALVPLLIKPFDPLNDVLFIYFTPGSHIRIQNTFPYAYGNLYKYVSHHDDLVGGFNTFTAKIDTTTAILFNFNRIKQIYPISESHNEINSINTNTILTNFDYNYLTKEVYKPNHGLKIGDIIVTDQFTEPGNISDTYVYEIDNIIDTERFTIIKYNHGDRYKFIYDGIIINFNSTNDNDSQYWLDQISANEEIIPLMDPEQTVPGNNLNNTLSFVSINPLSINNNRMIIFHPNHQLNTGDKITITNSRSINQVPEVAINKQHVINRVLNENYYEVALDKYIPTDNEHKNSVPNIVAIKYPDIFQLFFNFQDTLGNLLSFNKVGEDIAITPYKHIIANTDPYTNDYNYDSLGSEYQQRLKKLNMTGYNYFYISCPELATINNTKPVPNVFSIIRWSDNPGSVVIDSFAPTTKYFNNPVASISELHFTMIHPDGRLVEFNGLDHSFTIEIVELYNQPNGTNINARMNSEIHLKKFEL